MTEIKSMYSLTQKGNAIAIAGLISEVLSVFGVGVVKEEISAVIIAIGIAISWYGRFRKGDVTAAGFRK